MSRKSGGEPNLENFLTNLAADIKHEIQTTKRRYVLSCKKYCHMTFWLPNLTIFLQLSKTKRQDMAATDQ